MDILSYIIVNILNTFIDLYLIVFYLKNIFSFKETNYILIFLLTFIFLIISNLFTNTNIILTFIMLLLSLTILSTIFSCTYKELSKVITFIIGAKAIIQFMVIIVCENIFCISSTLEKYNTFILYHIFINIICRYILLLLFIVYLEKIKQKRIQIKGFKFISIVMSIYFSISIILYNPKLFYFPNVGRTFTFVIIIYNFALIAFNKYQTVHEILERDMLQTNERILAEKRFIERKVEADENIKRMRHDLKNYYHILNGYANDGNIEEIKKFLETRIGILDNSSSFIHSGHSCIDSILNEKIFVMKEKNIQYTENLVNMYIGNIDVSDLSLLIGLALDNAIEAAEQVNDFKEIEFTAKNYQGYLVLYFKNSIISNSHPDFNKTSKLSDSFNHGFGVKGIKQFAKIYNGEMKYITEKDKVILRVTLSVSNG